MALNNRVALLSCLVFMLSLTIFFPLSMARNVGCIYQMIVDTGDQPDAGTNSTITLTLSSATGNSLTINDLSSWGLWGQNHVYFQRGTSDFFQRAEVCVRVCAITLTSDGKGDNPAWYAKRVQIAVIGPSDYLYEDFPVNQWLDSSEGHQLYTTVNLCPQESHALSSIV